MTSAPRYAPRSAFRTRVSAGELPALGDDFAATALDRPVVPLAAFGPRPAPTRAVVAPLPSPLRWVPVVLWAAICAGLGFGAVLALVG